MFDGFTTHRIPTSGATLHLRRGGRGDPLLLLHGYPQTHVMWHRVAPMLAQQFTVICPDLRGYGDSDKPEPHPSHCTYAKRETARDLVEMMEALGFSRFYAAGHDRGGRVLHQLLLDDPDRVSKAAVLDIVPTRKILETVDATLATAYSHWFFLIEPYPIPERLIASDPAFYLRAKLRQWSADPEAFAPEAIAEYVRCFRNPATIRATCEDYRAAASLDLEREAAAGARKIQCPLLVLWGAKGVMERCYDVLETWRERAVTVEGRSLPCGHFIPEERPEDTARSLLAFFRPSEYQFSKLAR